MEIKFNSKNCHKNSGNSQDLVFVNDYNEISLDWFYQPFQNKLKELGRNVRETKANLSSNGLLFKDLLGIFH